MVFRATQQPCAFKCCKVVGAQSDFQMSDMSNKCIFEQNDRYLFTVFVFICFDKNIKDVNNVI